MQNFLLFDAFFAIIKTKTDMKGYFYENCISGRISRTCDPFDKG